MKITTRIRFFIGIIIVLGIIAALFIYLNYTMSRASSTDARLEADSYVVGMDYSGTIISQSIQPGSRVEKGQELFVINSSGLREALLNEQIQSSSLSFKLDEQNNAILTANADGIVKQIDYQAGAFAPGNSTLAVITKPSSTFVTATYQLSPPDYRRINRDSKLIITLPDNEVIHASIQDIQLTNSESNLKVDTVVRAELERMPNSSSIFTDGTPVKAVLELDNNTWYQTLTDQVKKILTPQSEV